MTVDEDRINTMNRKKLVAFTLTEVVIAIGLFAFAILGVVFLLGSALNSAGQIQQDTAMANVIQSASATVLAMETNAASPVDLFFNPEGTAVSNQELALYRAVLARTQLPGEPAAMEVWLGRVVGPLPSTNRVAEFSTSRHLHRP